MRKGKINQSKEEEKNRCRSINDTKNRSYQTRILSLINILREIKEVVKNGGKDKEQQQKVEIYKKINTLELKNTISEVKI